MAIKIGKYYLTRNNPRELLKENQQLKEILHQASIGIQELIEQDIECPSNCSKLKEILNQQKEFIEYLENMLDNENDIFSVVRVKDVLSKYQEIIGNDTNVGSKGGKE